MVLTGPELGLTASIRGIGLAALGGLQETNIRCSPGGHSDISAADGLASLPPGSEGTPQMGRVPGCQLRAILGVGGVGGDLQKWSGSSRFWSRDRRLLESGRGGGRPAGPSGFRLAKLTIAENLWPEAAQKGRVGPAVGAGGGPAFLSRLPGGRNLLFYSGSP